MVIANDVDPIEMVMFLPALCRKMGVPYCILRTSPGWEEFAAGRQPLVLPSPRLVSKLVEVTNDETFIFCRIPLHSTMSETSKTEILIYIQC